MDVTFATFRQTNSAASSAANKKIPTQISFFFVCMNSIPKHQCGQHKIQPQNSQRRVDNGASGCPANPGRRRDGVVAVKQRNPRHRDGEHHALNQTVDQIHTPVDGILHC
eukprot:374636_1